MMTPTPTALILHDQPHVLRTLDYLVRSTGQLSVLPVGSVRQACEQMAGGLTALVVMDACRMPPDQAAQNCRELRSAWQVQQSQAGGRGERKRLGQIWFITSRASSIDLEEARDLGADRILTMPFDPDLVQHLVWEVGQQWGGQLAKAG